MLFSVPERPLKYSDLIVILRHIGTKIGELRISLYGTSEPVTIPEWTDANNFAAVIDPNLIPGVMIGEIFGVKPQIFSASSELDPAMFANDESRLKVRQLLNVGVADFRPLHKNNVA